MTADFDDVSVSHDPLAELERHLIRAYLAGAGQDLQQLLARDDEPARVLLANASQYAGMVLAEIEARWRFLRELRGEL